MSDLPRPGNDLRERVQGDFRDHRVGEDQDGRMRAIRELCAGLGVMIADKVPPGREQSTALTRLEEVMFHANAGIARKG